MEAAVGELGVVFDTGDAALVSFARVVQIEGSEVRLSGFQAHTDADLSAREVFGWLPTSGTGTGAFPLCRSSFCFQKLSNFGTSTLFAMFGSECQLSIRQLLYREEIGNRKDIGEERERERER